MLYYCGFKWHPHTTREKVAQRILQLHGESGANVKQYLKGWYNLVGGGAGFLLVEADDPHKVTAFTQPYMDLMSFDVRAIYSVDYDQQIQELRQVAQSTSAR